MPISLGVRALTIFILIGALALLRAMPPAMLQRFRAGVEMSFTEGSELQQTFTEQEDVDAFADAKALWVRVLSAVQGAKSSH
jgi:hypothetical protein